MSQSFVSSGRKYELRIRSPVSTAESFASAAKLTLDNPDVDGDEVTFDVTLELGAGTQDYPSTISATLTFDPDVLETGDFDTDSAFATAYEKTLEVNEPDPGTVKILVGSILTANEITDASILIGTITFDIQGTAGAETDLTWSDVRMSDGSALLLEDTSGDNYLGFIVP